MRFEELETEALKLPEEGRAKLAHSLILSLDEDPCPDPEVQRLWAEEAERRYEEFLAGKAEAVPGDEAFQRARASLR